jgi:hypothetical protein
MRRLVAASCGFVLAVAILEAAQKKPADLVVPLKFQPQESVRASSVALPTNVIDRALEIRVEDGRELPDLRTIGTGTDDDDVTFAIRSTTDVAPWVTESVAQMAAAQAFKKGPPADRVLKLRLTRFNVNEMNKAVGSTYVAEVHFAYTLLDADGKTLFEGAAAGTTSRYGRARSTGNAAEVLSDALKDAFAKTIGDAALQKAWGSGKPAAPAAAPAGGQPPAAAPASASSIEQRLKTLDDLLKKGVITKEEHAARRAAILKEI